MKHKILISILLVSAAGHAQVQKTDDALIRETVMNYVEGFYSGDMKRVEKAVHPELVKRIVQRDTNGAMITNMGASGLVFAAGKQKGKTEKSGEPFRADISVYDIFQDVATVKVVTNKFNFIDYAQLVKINGDWKILNVLWEFKK